MSYYLMHRDWMEDRLWQYDKYSKREAWCWLIEKAKYEDREEFIRGESVIIKRGSLVKTERQLAKEWRWGRQRVRTFLKTLEKDKKIVVNLTQHLTLISIMNYVTYQERQPSQKPHDNPAITQQKPSYKESKEVKERKEKKPKGSCQQVDAPEITALWNSKGLGKLTEMPPSRRQKINSRTKERFKDLQAWDDYFQMFADSNFLSGKSNNWKATFDWALNPTNMCKVLEGNYINGSGNFDGFDPTAHMKKIREEEEEKNEDR